MAIMGNPGSGKTPLISTWPKTLILDGDRGLASAVVQGSLAEYWTMEDWNDMIEAYDYLRHEGCKEYDFVWLDSMTLFQERGLDDIMRTLVESKSHRKVFLPDRGEYGENFNRLSLWMRDMLKIPMHMGYTAHVGGVVDERTGDTVYMPWVQGKNMAQKISSYMNIVALLEREEVEGELTNVLYLRQDADHMNYLLRDRYGLFEDGYVVEPTMPKIMTAFQAVVSRHTPARPVAAKAAAKKAAAPVKKAVPKKAAAVTKKG